MLRHSNLVSAFKFGERLHEVFVIGKETLGLSSLRHPLRLPAFTPTFKKHCESRAVFRKTDICYLNAAGTRKGRFAGQEDTETQLWGKGLCLQVLCLPLGLVCLVAQVLFHEYFYFIAGFKAEGDRAGATKH